MFPERAAGGRIGRTGLGPIPAALFADGNAAASQRVMTAMLEMKKLDLDALKRAFDGEPVPVLNPGQPLASSMEKAAPVPKS